MFRVCYYPQSHLKTLWFQPAGNAIQINVLNAFLFVKHSLNRFPQIVDCLWLKTWECTMVKVLRKCEALLWSCQFRSPSMTLMKKTRDAMQRNILLHTIQHSTLRWAVVCHQHSFHLFYWFNSINDDWWRLWWFVERLTNHSYTRCHPCWCRLSLQILNKHKVIMVTWSPGPGIELKSITVWLFTQFWWYLNKFEWRKEFFLYNFFVIFLFIIIWTNPLSMHHFVMQRNKFYCNMKQCCSSVVLAQSERNGPGNKWVFQLKPPCSCWWAQHVYLCFLGWRGWAGRGSCCRK